VNIRVWLIEKRRTDIWREPKYRTSDHFLAALISLDTDLKTDLYRKFKPAINLQIATHSEELPVFDRPDYGALRMMQRCVRVREMVVDDTDRRTEYAIPN
jgi:hypothetical protein